MLRFQCKNGYANAPQGYVTRTLPILLFRPWYVTNTKKQEQIFILNKFYSFHTRRTLCKTRQTFFGPSDIYLTYVRVLDVSCRNIGNKIQRLLRFRNSTRRQASKKALYLTQKHRKGRCIWIKNTEKGVVSDSKTPKRALYLTQKHRKGRCIWLKTPKKALYLTQKHRKRCCIRLKNTEKGVVSDSKTQLFLPFYYLGREDSASLK